MSSGEVWSCRRISHSTEIHLIGKRCRRSIRITPKKSACKTANYHFVNFRSGSAYAIRSGSTTLHLMHHSSNLFSLVCRFMATHVKSSSLSQEEVVNDPIIKMFRRKKSLSRWEPTADNSIKKYISVRFPCSEVAYPFNRYSSCLLRRSTVRQVVGKSYVDPAIPSWIRIQIPLFSTVHSSHAQYYLASNSVVIVLAPFLSCEGVPKVHCNLSGPGSFLRGMLGSGSDKMTRIWTRNTGCKVYQTFDEIRLAQVQRKKGGKCERKSKKKKMKYNRKLMNKE